MGKSGEVLVKDLDKKDKNTFSLWLQDINVVKFLIDLFKVSRMNDNILNVPFGKNRKMFLIENKKGYKLGFCVIYNIDWQLRKCSMYIYIENKEDVNEDTAKDILKTLVGGTFVKYKLRNIEIHTKDDIILQCIENPSNIHKDEEGYSFSISVDEMEFPINMAQ